MKSPWDIDNKAFEPFYDKTVAISSNGQRTSLKACIFEETFDDPLSDYSPSTTCRRISIFVPKYGEGGWNFTTSPKVGDAVTLVGENGKANAENFVLDTVSDFVDSWKLTAREVEP